MSYKALYNLHQSSFPVLGKFTNRLSLNGHMVFSVFPTPNCSHIQHIAYWLMKNIDNDKALLSQIHSSCSTDHNISTMGTKSKGAVKSAAWIREGFLEHRSLKFVLNGWLGQNLTKGKR